MVWVEILYIFQSPKDYIVFIDRINRYMRCFHNNYDVHKYKKLMDLKEYYNFIIAYKDYKAKLTTTNKVVKKLCKKMFKVNLMS